MGRFHRHGDGTVHTHEPEHGDHGRYATGKQRVEVLEAIFAEN
ncbi:MAG: hydrogenase accessory protein HypB, partial [Mycobacterium sp.]|nr:hydrogenase accessory protein HypB [Mycobacterium sp.]